MIINSSNIPVVLGRFRILPGEKVPTVMLTSEEQEALDRLKAKRIFKETGPKEVGSKVEAPKEAPKVQKVADKVKVDKPATPNKQDTPIQTEQAPVVEKPEA